jgi:hypothetical protein
MGRAPFLGVSTKNALRHIPAFALELLESSLVLGLPAVGPLLLVWLAQTTAAFLLFVSLSHTI